MILTYRRSACAPGGELPAYSVNMALVL